MNAQLGWFCLYFAVQDFMQVWQYADDGCELVKQIHSQLIIYIT